eukprot:6408722-Pyramimonas_sp.AAC.1
MAPPDDQTAGAARPVCHICLASYETHSANAWQLEASAAQITQNIEDIRASPSLLGQLLALLVLPVAEGPGS